VLVILIDGLDYQLLSYVAPLVIAEFGVSKAELGTALAAALVGMAIGAIVGGTIGDRIGRKPTIVITTALFGLTTIATGFAGNLTELVVLRLIAGLGFGAAFPNALALTAEWMPVKLRTMAIALCTVGSAVGGLIGAGVAALLIPLGGWRSCFLFSGIFTVAAAVLLVVLLLESPGYLLKKGLNARLHQVLRTAFPADPALPAPTEPSPAPIDGRQPSILSRRYLRTNIALWVATIGYAVASFGTYSWTTTILMASGLSLNAALLGASAYSSLALAGPLISGAIATVLSSRTVLFGLLVIWIGASLALLSALSIAAAPWLSYLCLAVIGFCAGSYAAVLYAAAADLYEPAARSGGIGATIGVSRIGGIMATAIGGALLTLDPTFAVFYISMAILLAGSLIGVWLMPRGYRAPTRA
ncbi:MAG: MFS transporter, partial [Sphingomonadales bacterium]